MNVSDPLNHLGLILYHSEPLEVPYFPNQFTEGGFASFLSGEFTNMAVINPPERKLAKRISLQFPGWGLFLQQTESSSFPSVLTIAVCFI